MIRRAANGILRMSASSIRFVLLAVMVRVLDPAAVGTYGLLASAVQLFLLMGGLEFGAVTVRNAVGARDGGLSAALRIQGRYQGAALAILSPVWVGAFWLGPLPFELLLPVSLWLATEFVASEGNRLLVGFEQQLRASVVLVVRLGGGPILALLALWGAPTGWGLKTVVWCTVVGNAFAAALVTHGVRGVLRAQSIHAARCVSGGDALRAAIPLWLAHLGLKIVFVMDRFLVEQLEAAEVLAAYVFWSSASSAMLSLLDAVVFAFAVPPLLREANRATEEGVRRAVCQLRSGIVGVLAAASLFAGAGYALFGEALLPASYRADTVMIVGILGAFGVYAFGMVSSQQLVALRAERLLLACRVAGVGLFLLSAPVLGRMHGAHGVLAGMLVGLLTQTLLQERAAAKVLRESAVRWSHKTDTIDTDRVPSLA